MTDEIKLVVTAERMRGVKIGVMRAFTSGDLWERSIAAADLIAHYMVNGTGDYLPPRKARAIADQMDADDLDKWTKELADAMNEAAAPKA